MCSKASGAGIFAPDRECMGEPTAVRQKPSSVSIGAGWCFFNLLDLKRTIWEGPELEPASPDHR